MPPKRKAAAEKRAKFKPLTQKEVEHDPPMEETEPTAVAPDEVGVAPDAGTDAPVMEGTEGAETAETDCFVRTLTVGEPVDEGAQIEVETVVDVRSDIVATLGEVVEEHESVDEGMDTTENVSTLLGINFVSCFLVSQNLHGYPTILEPSPVGM